VAPFFAVEIIEWADARDRPLRLWADERRLFARCAMAVKLNRSGFSFGKKLVSEGRLVRDERDAWSEDQPSAEQENEFIRAHEIKAYAKWHLGIDTEHPEDTKGRYKFPFGDFKRVHRCAVLSAESRAGQRAAAHLHEMIDGKKHKVRTASA
jgi:hypothetical protein